jgi:hypothetical protein
MTLLCEAISLLGLVQDENIKFQEAVVAQVGKEPQAFISQPVAHLTLEKRQFIGPDSFCKHSLALQAFLASKARERGM